MVVSTETNSSPPEKKGKAKRPPLNPLSFPRLVKSRSLVSKNIIPLLREVNCFLTLRHRKPYI